MSDATDTGGTPVWVDFPFGYRDRPVRHVEFWWCRACETCLGPDSGCDCAERCTCGRLRDQASLTPAYFGRNGPLSEQRFD